MVKNNLGTRMHYSRMRTVCCSGHWGRISQNALGRGCLPRGCILGVCVCLGMSAQGGVPGGCLPRGCLPGVVSAGGMSAKGVSAQGDVCLGGHTPHPCGQNDRRL